MRLNNNQFLPRYKSVLTGGEIEELYSIKNFPVFIGSTSEDILTDIFHDLTFDICKQSGLIQLRDIIDSNIIYSRYHSEAIGSIWNEHHKLFTDLLSKYSNKKSNILEIGGSDFRLAFKFLEQNKVNKWMNIEPNLKQKIDHPIIKYIEDFFDKNVTKKHDIQVGEYDIVTYSHVLEHIIDPKIFLNDVSNILKDGDYHIFSFPNLYEYLNNKYVNTINFEHTLFITEPILDYLLSCYNFKIIEKQYYREHSIFYVTQKHKTVPLCIPNKYREYREMYLDFINYYQKFVNNLNEVLENTSKDVYLFGGHVFSQFLIILGLNTNKIKCVLDNSKLKNGKRLYGSNVYIKSPYDIDLNENSLVILKVGQYKDEIKNQLLNINSDIKFYE